MDNGLPKCECRAKCEKYESGLCACPGIAELRGQLLLTIADLEKQLTERLDWIERKDKEKDDET